MEGVTNNSSSGGKVFSLLLFIVGLVGLYYLYYYLFGSSVGTRYELIEKSIPANPSEKITVSSTDLPMLYEGGEFTFSTWIYVNNWSYRSGFNKSILTIGGRNLDTIRIYLGGFKPSLQVRFHTKEAGKGNDLAVANQKTTFTDLQTGSQLLESGSSCDISEIELQRWVFLTVSVNGKTVDIYIDGKLTRSCVLPNLFKVDASGYAATLLDYGGFGGLITSAVMYDTALSPDRVYKDYMAGPEPITSIVEWFKSFFA
jgi:hypothetical protein